MRTPFLLCGAALLFWGWHTGHLPTAVLLAVVLETSRFVTARLDGSDALVRRAWDGTALVVVLAAVACYLLWPVSEALLTFLQWWPILFFPFVALLAYNAESGVDLATFLWLQRRGRASQRRPVRLQVSHGYFALCLLSASATNNWSPWFYAGLALLSGWAVWGNRSRRVPDPVVLLLLLAVAGAGYAGHRQLRRWHLQLEKTTAQWIRIFQRSAFDDLTAHMSLGRIGEVKESRRLLLLLEPDNPDHPPPLLRLSSYNRLYLSTWFGARRRLAPAFGDGSGSWRLFPVNRGPDFPIHSARMFARLPGGRGLLPLPPGTFRLDRLPALEVSTTQYGAVRVEGSPNTVYFRMNFNNRPQLDQLPTPLDLDVPDTESNAVVRIARFLHLQDPRPPREKLVLLGNFFQRHFRYAPYRSLDSSWPRSGQSVLAPFLLETRTGHCEYFATAAVLLLRQAGIPARYATGFAVQPASRTGRAYLVGERDAHAWALVYLDGRWEDVDLTPGGWRDIETRQSSLLSSLSDGWSRFWFQFKWWRATSSSGVWFPYLLTLACLLLGGLSWPVLRQAADWRRTRRTPAPQALLPLRGGDSEFYKIEQLLQRQGWGRAAHETFRQWLFRVEEQATLPGFQTQLAAALRLHYRLRFDPAGLSPDARLTLARKVDHWLNQTNKPSRRRPFLRRFRG